MGTVGLLSVHCWRDDVQSYATVDNCLGMKWWATMTREPTTSLGILTPRQVSWPQDRWAGPKTGELTPRHVKWPQDRWADPKTGKLAPRQVSWPQGRLADPKTGELTPRQVNWPKDRWAEPKTGELTPGQLSWPSCTYMCLGASHQALPCELHNYRR